MKDHCNDIPLEIWASVLNYVEKPKDLCQCRLVCKNWDYIAETALFTKELCLSGIQNVSKMYNHLAKNPQRAHLIKYLDFQGILGNEPETQRLLRAAFTTTMEYLAGEDEYSSMPPEFFATLNDIVERAPPDSRFRLQKMAHGISNHEQMDENYARVAYAFRNTLETLEATIGIPYMRAIFDNLKAFKQLQFLVLHGRSIATLDDLESILGNCEKLKGLQLWITDYHTRQQMNTDITDWIKTHVQRVDSLMTLETDVIDPVVIQYLAYKYPKSTWFRCSACFYETSELFRQLVDAAKSMVHFETQVFIENSQEIERLLADLSRLNDTPTTMAFSIRPALLTGNDLTAEVEITIENRPNRTIQLDVGYERSSTLDFLALLASLGRCNLSNLHLDTTNYRPTLTKDEVAMNAIDIIERLPNLKEMFLAVDKLQYKSCELDDRHIDWKMNSLTIRETTIDSRAIAQISQFSPQLEIISFQDCFTAIEGQTQESMFDVDMPQSFLQRMAIQKVVRRNASWDKETINMIQKNLRFHVQIHLLHRDIQIYLFCSSALNAVVPSLEVFESLPDKDVSTNIKITVADLKQLELKWDCVRTVFDVEKYLAIDELRKECMTHTLALENADLTEDLVNNFKRLRIDYTARARSLMGDSKDLNSAVFS